MRCCSLVDRRSAQALLHVIDLGGVLTDRRLEPSSFASFWTNMAPKPFDEVMAQLIDEERQFSNLGRS